MGKELQKVKLRQMTQKGLDQAAAMLSRLLRQQIQIEVSGSWSRDCGCLGDADSVWLGVYMGVCGELQGGLLLVLSEKRARSMAQQLLGMPVGAALTEEPACSTLREVGNIVASAFLASIDDQLGLRALPEPPQLHVAQLDRLLEQHRTQQKDACLAVRTDLVGAETGPVEGAIFLLPEQASLDLLYQRIDQAS
ncbi:chemotaxis protein CheC [Malonomonas rubra DSM 5091]|uniref:Chemotaxis protein CheC n=1 Tax=Malonomonas rubra DSM 5091 TaxID=1122189 RepID=A0A1M6JXY7_MALRU|nr:chemotaxis protein CheC [Malonomonas rubra]SHJ51569.1 chemotaxis protein CheC [Malonomonas rubra DSM 5091]